jgi:hypothetical protein
LDAGVVESRFTVHGLGIVLRKSERLVWLFNDARLYDLKKRSSFVGGSQGVSIRIARGVYYRVGAFSGHRVQTDNLELQSTGSLVVTDQNVYFEGLTRSLRLPIKKIVNVNGYSDGIGLVRESVNPKPPVIINLDDPWFACNLILKLGALAQ